MIDLRVCILFLTSFTAVHSSTAQVPYPPDSYPGTTDPAEIDFYDYDFSLPATKHGFVLDPKNYLSDLDPHTRPSELGGRLSTFATRGETEAVSFVIYAQADLSSVSIHKPALVNTDDHVSLGSKSIDIKTVFRTFRRTLNNVGGPAVSGCGNRRLGDDRRSNGKLGYCLFESNRYVVPYEPFDVQAGHFREVLLYFHVPKDADPGQYTGTVTVAAADDPGKIQELDVSLEVLPYELQEDPDNRMGVYYDLLWSRLANNGVDPMRRAVAELKDIKKHHGSMLTGTTGWWGNTRVHYCADGRNAHGQTYACEDGQYDSVSWDFTMLRRWLEAIDRAGYETLDLVIGTGFQHLAKQMGYPEISRRAFRDGTIENPDQVLRTLANDDEYLNAAAKMLEGLKTIQANWPQYRLIFSHMDEVFNEHQLKAYETFSKIFRAAADSAAMEDAELYTTFHTRDTEVPYWGNEIHTSTARKNVLDPYIDLRGHHGYTFEHWLMNHDTETYETELLNSGDRATFYHNARGYWLNTEVERLISGLFQWSVPLQARLQWTYHNGAMIWTGGEREWLNEQFNELDEIDYVLAVPCHDQVVPCSENNITPVPTRRWEAMREGQEDIRYLHTLRQAIGQQPESPVAEEASRWLDSLRLALPMRPKRWSFDWTSPSESPITQHMYDHFEVDDYQNIRRRAASYTEQLIGSPPEDDRPDSPSDASYELLSNYPDPLRSFTIIPFVLPEPGRVEVSVFNILGQKVATLIDERVSAGDHVVQWRLDDRMPSGTYYYRIETPNFRDVRSMTIVK